MNPVYIIAEAGVNHNGNLDLAIKMIDEAVRAEADAVKFQTFRAEDIATVHAPKAEYQKNTTALDVSQFAMLKSLELSVDDHHVLMKYCRDKNIEFLSSPFDLTSIDILVALGLKIWKIPSGEITNLPYLRKIGSCGEKIILSTGMSTMDEIEAAINVFVQAGIKKSNIIVLHCNTEYPTPMKDVNLKAMESISRRFGVVVGYSDHTEGIEVPIAAVALGAAVIEKHFTLDKTMNGPDHRASIEPYEFAAMVRSIRNIEAAMGSGEKLPSPSEISNKSIVRKSIVASKRIKKGERITEDLITVKRPGNGLSPMLWDDIIGTIAEKDYNPDDLI